MSDLTPYDFMENASMPPLSNRGAQSTTESGLKACVDWFQVTFKSIHNVQEIIEFLELENAEFLDCGGKYGYRHGIVNNGIFIFYGGSYEMGVHLQLSGTGCRYIENIFDNFEWYAFFGKIVDLGNYNITRIDIALDDFNKIMSIPALKRKIKKGECVSKFKGSIAMESINISDGESKGNTLYFGKPNGMLQVRFYEKHLELKNKGIEHDIKFWNRYELQLRKERADTVFHIIYGNPDNDLAFLIKGILTNYIRFVNTDKNDSNKSRWKIYRPWQKFINEVEKIKLTKSKAEKDIFDSYDWLSRQVAPTIAMLTEAGITDLTEVIQDGKTRLKDIHIKKITEFKKRDKSNE